MSQKEEPDTTKMGILLACHHGLLKAGLQYFCGDYPDFTLLQTYSTAESIKSSDFNINAMFILICSSCNPDFIIHAQKHLPRLKLLFPKAHPVVINHQTDEKKEKELIRLGVKGFFPKEVYGQALFNSFEAIHKGQIWVSRKVSQSLLSDLLDGNPAAEYHKPEPPYSLSRREVEILHAIAAGLSNLEISNKLFISEKTVKAHTNHIFKKMAVKSRTQAVKKALEHKVI